MGLYKTKRACSLIIMEKTIQAPTSFHVIDKYKKSTLFTIFHWSEYTISSTCCLLATLSLPCWTRMALFQTAHKNPCFTTFDLFFGGKGKEVKMFILMIGGLPCTSIWLTSLDKHEISIFSSLLKCMCSSEMLIVATN